MKKEKVPLCPIHKEPLLKIYGCGWDYDILTCGVKIGPFGVCEYEEILETSSYPEEEEKMIKVTNEVEIYEINGKEQKIQDSPKLIVKNHWNDSRKVVLVFPEKEIEITVVENDLHTAINNATNTSQW